LAGLVTATLMSLRFDRALLIQSQGDFSRFFRPYHHQLNTTGINQIRSTDKNPFDDSNAFELTAKPYRNNQLLYSWNNIRPRLLERTNSTFSEYCMNPSDDDITMCHFDHNLTELLKYQVIKVQSNRAFICRWARRRSNIITFQQMKRLGLTGNDVDLFEAAGTSRSFFNYCSLYRVPSCIYSSIQRSIWL
jgi:hypothetical protein